MRLINRSVFIIRPKEPYIEWASGTDDEAPATAHRMRDRVAVYLVPEDPTGREETPLLKDYYKEIFECELEAWYLDEDVWPEPRTLEMFLDWFDVSGQSVITDLGKGAVEAEEY